MVTFIEVHWTSASIEEARQVSCYLVQQQLVACAQILPCMESIYVWKDQLETAQENKVVFKTRLEKFAKIKEAILQNCSYQVPEITYQIISDGHQEYLDWLKAVTSD